METTREFCKRIKGLPVEERTILVNERLSKTKSTLTGWEMFWRLFMFGIMVVSIIFAVVMILY